MNKYTNIIAIKRAFNILSRKQIIKETEILTEEEKEIIQKYPNQNELEGLYKLSTNNFSSFREMILGQGI
jgi:hypothetical protein